MLNKLGNQTIRDTSKTACSKHHRKTIVTRTSLYYIIIDNPSLESTDLMKHNLRCPQRDLANTEIDLLLRSRSL